MRARRALAGLLLLAACGAPPAPPVMNSATVTDAAGRVPDLVCPGAAGCEDATGALAVGAAKRDVTPSLDAGPVWLAGFSLGRRATGVHDPTWVRVLSVSKGRTRLGLVVFDLVGLFHDDVLRIREGAVALGFDHVMVSTTHNHEAKDTMGMWGEKVGTTGHDPAYHVFLVESAVAALREARDAERATGAKVAVAEAPPLVADTRFPLVVDQGIYTLAFGGDQVFATLTVWGNHPEALGSHNTLVTSDFPHYFREKMEARFPGAISVYLSGILGGLTTPLPIEGCPDAQGNETCPTGTFEKARYVGEGAADAAIAALDGAGATTDADPALDLRRRSLLLATSNSLLALGVQFGILPRAIFLSDGTRVPAEESRTVPIGDLQTGQAKVQTEVNAFRVGPVQFLAIPGELYAELWLDKPDGSSYAERPENADFPDAAVDPALRGLLPAAPFKVVLNNANDALGYILPKTQWDTDEPYAYEPEGQYGEQNSTGPDTAGLLHGAVRELLQLTVR